MVGCVIARNDRIIGEGWHRRFAGPHAEIEALTACKGSPKGATAYVSLEPCCHVGKTPPCTDALIQAGIHRVVVALRDPRAHSGENGVALLRRAGIKVDIGTEAGAAAEVLAPYLTRACLRRPFVMAKWAQSLDGKLSTISGDSRWISNESSRRFVHQIRARVDAILVGSQTAIIDDPCLTARDVPLRRRAKRIVLDTRLRLPLGCRLVETAREIPTLIFTSAERAKSPKGKRLQARGVQVEPCRTKGGRISPRAVLSRLAQLEVTNLLVEGGPTILTSFFEDDVVDEAHVFTSPMLIGGRDAPSVIGGRGAPTVSNALRPRLIKTRRCGDDTLSVMRFTDPPLTGAC
jgi:diaminohydroxyphosphoribosylaminopyrimidine deaminase/5-amino-6-(5-phosphoribosylamino)uracil reductase